MIERKTRTVKKPWRKPEISSLDFNKTLSGAATNSTEDDYFDPGS